MAAKPSFELRLRVLNAVYEAPGNTVRERIKCAAAKTFADVLSGQTFQFTWRTSHHCKTRQTPAWSLP